MPGCSVKSCVNYDRKNNKKIDDITYHRFPTDPVRNEVWSRVLRHERGEPYFKPNRYLRVCSAHFKADDFYLSGSRRMLKKTAIPSIMVQALFSEAEHSSVTIKVEPDGADKNSRDDLIDVDISDLTSIFDTPREVSLKQKRDKYKMLNLAKYKKIKILQTQNARLKKKNDFLIDNMKELKNKIFYILDSHSIEQPLTHKNILKIRSIIERCTNVRKHNEPKMENMCQEFKNN